MKITHTDGSVTNTDKLNDFSAELMEKVDEFHSFMMAHKVPYFLSFNDPVRKMHSGATHINEENNLDEWSQLLFYMDRVLKQYGAQVIPYSKDES